MTMHITSDEGVNCLFGRGGQQPPEFQRLSALPDVLVALQIFRFWSCHIRCCLDQDIHRITRREGALRTCTSPMSLQFSLLILPQTSTTTLLPFSYFISHACVCVCLSLYALFTIFLTHLSVTSDLSVPPPT